MDKDTKAKAEEFIKKNSVHELNLDDLENVSGGADGIYASNGRYYTEKEILDLGREMARNFGFDIAGEVMCNFLRVSVIEARNIKRGDISDVDKMDVLINRIFCIYDRLEKTGHSY